MLYSYVITRDYGFAPNPFYGYCTLATCKPRIRRYAQIGDWIVGTESISMGHDGKRIIFAMKIDEKLTFREYWNDMRFQCKKPVMNGSKKQMYGDNIYEYNEIDNVLVQVDSHHSLANGEKNNLNYDRDVKGEYVLISKKFWYFGSEGPEIPDIFSEQIIKRGIGHRIIHDENLIRVFIAWLENNYKEGYLGEPYEFKKDFKRYNGI